MIHSQCYNTHNTKLCFAVFLGCMPSPVFPVLSLLVSVHKWGCHWTCCIHIILSDTKLKSKQGMTAEKNRYRRYIRVNYICFFLSVCTVINILFILRRKLIHSSGLITITILLHFFSCTTIKVIDKNAVFIYLFIYFPKNVSSVFLFYQLHLLTLLINQQNLKGKFLCSSRMWVSLRSCHDSSEIYETSFREMIQLDDQDPEHSVSQRSFRKDASISYSCKFNLIIV